MPRRKRQEQPIVEKPLVEKPLMGAKEFAKLHGMNYPLLLRWMQYGERLANGQVVKFPCIPLESGRYLVRPGAYQRFADMLEAAAGISPATSQPEGSDEAGTA